MTDRDLLEKAAKAAGIDLRWNVIERDADGFPLDPFDTEWCFIPDCKPPHNRRKGDQMSGQLWNPLTDVEDATRLLLKLRLRVDYVGDQPCIEGCMKSGMTAEESFCRAVTRAAAAMGEKT